MLTLVIPGQEVFNEETEEFSTVGDITLEFEHSLVALARWESKWKVPFLGPDKKTTEQTFGYIEAMCLTPDVPPETFLKLTDDNIKAINEYIEDTHTATWFKELPGQSRINREIVTAEIIYYWMVTMHLPMEMQYWHLNKLITQIRVVNQKNQPPKKMGKAEALAQQRELNKKRQQQYATRG